LEVLRSAEKIENGLEDAPFDEAAGRQCQDLGWLDNATMLTPAGRRVLEDNAKRGSIP
jgi:hypothetical protein